MQENIDKIKEKIQEYQNKDVYIELENAISYHFLICNAKLLVSQEMLFITDEKKENFLLELHSLEDVDINNNTIYLEMSNDLKITLDY